MKPKAIVLLSGGMDSATTLAIAEKNGHDLYCITYKYGQRAIKEIECAKKIAKRYNAIEHKIIDIGFLGDIVSSSTSLVDGGLDIKNEITDSPTENYVPFRNTILLSIAIAWAESIGAKYVYIGAHRDDYNSFPDCRPEYFNSLAKTICCGTKDCTINVVTPLIYMPKMEIVRVGHELRVPFELTWSCYKTGDEPCHKCESCQFREAAFFEAGHTDPLLK